MEIALIIALAAGAVAGGLAAAELRYVNFRRFGALALGAIGGGLGFSVASRIAANAPGGVVLPGGADAAISALVSGAIGGAAMVAALGVVQVLLAER
jgi:hypothetical protein